MIRIPTSRRPSRFEADWQTVTKKSWPTEIFPSSALRILRVRSLSSTDLVMNGFVGRGRAMTPARAVMLATAVATLSGCASSSDKIGSQYVSPIQYASLSCAQLGEEAQRVSSRVAHLSGVQDRKATNDAIATGVAIVVFWPAAFLVGGNDQNTAELSRLKGEFDALEQASIRKNCGLQSRQQPAANPPRGGRRPKADADT